MYFEKGILLCETFELCAHSLQWNGNLYVLAAEYVVCTWYIVCGRMIPICFRNVSRYFCAKCKVKGYFSISVRPPPGLFLYIISAFGHVPGDTRKERDRQQ